jgi:hypothetical protein
MGFQALVSSMPLLNIGAAKNMERAKNQSVQAVDA